MYPFPTFWIFVVWRHIFHHRVKQLDLIFLPFIGKGSEYHSDLSDIHCWPKSCQKVLFVSIGNNYAFCLHSIQRWMSSDLVIFRYVAHQCVKLRSNGLSYERGNPQSKIQKCWKGILGTSLYPGSFIKANMNGVSALN